MARILIAFDGSPSARTAVARAGALLPGAHATVLAVAPGLAALADAGAARAALPDEVIRTGVARLRETALQTAEASAQDGCAAARAAGLEPEARTTAADEPVWQAILDAARETGADAVVCGTRGHGAAARAVLGSVASALVRHAELPVLVVHEEAPAAAGPVVLAYDGSEAAGAAVRSVATLLGGRDAVVVHAWRSEIRHTLTGAALRHAPVDDVREMTADLDALFEQEAQAVADAGVELAREHGLQARAELVESADAPAQAILALADAHDAAAIVVGRRGRGGVASALLGSVSSSLVHAAARPVVVARG